MSSQWEISTEIASAPATSRTTKPVARSIASSTGTSLRPSE